MILGIFLLLNINFNLVQPRAACGRECSKTATQHLQTSGSGATLSRMQGICSQRFGRKEHSCLK